MDMTAISATCATATGHAGCMCSDTGTLVRVATGATTFEVVYDGMVTRSQTVVEGLLYNLCTSVDATRDEVALANRTPDELLIAEYLDDSALPHQGIPHGLSPSVNWAQHGIVNSPSPPPDIHYATPWGIIYVDESSPVPPTNTRVQLGYIRLHVLTVSQGWLTYTSLAGHGGWWPENDFTVPKEDADQRLEEDGFTSVTAGNGKAFHFFPPSLTAIDREDVIGIAATAEARLIVANPSLPDDRASARYLALAGADWWEDPEIPPGPDFSHAPQAGAGRFHYVTNDWQTVRISTVNALTLLASPPPADS